MNLWTIVLLGILAQTSNGYVELKKEKFENEINNAFSESLQNLNARTLPSVPLSTSLQVHPRITDVASIKTASAHLGDSKWFFNISLIIVIDSDSFTDIKLKAEASGELGAGLENDHLNLKMIPDKLSVSATVQTPVTELPPSLGLAGAYTDKCKQLLKAKIQQTCKSAVQTLNLKLQRIITHFAVWGSTGRYKVRKLDFGSKSIILYVDMVRKTAEGVTSTPLYVPQLTTSGLQQGWSWSFYFGESWFSSALNAVPIEYKRSLTPEEFGAYKIFSGTVGNVVVQVKGLAPLDCKITPAESKATGQLSVSLSDEAENPRLQIEVTFSITVVIKSDGFLRVGLGLSQLSISNTNTSNGRQRCSNCENNDPTANIEILIHGCVNEAIDNWKSQVQQPLPLPAPLPGLPDNVSCSNGNGVTKCGA